MVVCMVFMGICLVWLLFLFLVGIYYIYLLVSISGKNKVLEIIS